MKKLFGTDGIRGTANQFPMTPEIAMQVGRAIAKKAIESGAHAKTGQKPKILIGKDTRVSGYMIEHALAAGLCSMGANVLLVGPLPTPGIAFLTQNMRADAGIVISASHNPYQDNGIKIFARDGYKFPVEVEKEIEDLVLGNELGSHVPTADKVGQAKRIDDAIGRYVVFVKNTFPQKYTLEGLRIVLDCANGAAYKVGPWVFEELGAEVIKLGVDPNGRNINDNCGALHPEAVCEAVKLHKADIGISLDGDADRCILSDEKGEVVNGDHILGICALDMDERGELPHKTVVATSMSNLGLELALRAKNIKLLKTDVGDKYVVEAMRQGRHPIGGEQSGHIVFGDHSTTGDGLIAALRVLAVMRSKSKKLSELKSFMNNVPQVLKNVKVSKRVDLKTVKGYSELTTSHEKRLADQGRILVRYSGTEPLVRVLVEGVDGVLIQSVADDIAGFIKKELG